ncbi:MAG: hypothetical protein Q8O93_00960 [bacterium]|nr:hypothetical protein [bacterium]
MDNPNLEQEKTNDKKIDAKLRAYVDTDGLGTKRLEAGLWYIEHKQKLRLALYGFFIITAAVSWSYTIYGFTYYFSRGVAEDELLVTQIAQLSGADHNYVKSIAARDLAAEPVKILKSADGKYDFYARLKNLNDKWWAEFDYYFSADGRQTEKTGSYILPLEEKYPAALAQSFDYLPANAELIIENMVWRRIDRHRIPDWNAYYAGHLDITSADIKFIPAAASLLSEKLNLNELSFSLSNNTVYNYWEAGFTILLYSGGQIAGINHYTLNDFMSGEKREVKLSWTGNLKRVDRIDIIPEINIMKDNIYIKYEGGAGQPSGGN